MPNPTPPSLVFILTAFYPAPYPAPNVRSFVRCRKNVKAVPEALRLRLSLASEARLCSACLNAAKRNVAKETPPPPTTPTTTTTTTPPPINSFKALKAEMKALKAEMKGIYEKHRIAIEVNEHLRRERHALESAFGLQDRPYGLSDRAVKRRVTNIVNTCLRIGGEDIDKTLVEGLLKHPEVAPLLPSPTTPVKPPEASAIRNVTRLTKSTYKVLGRRGLLPPLCQEREAFEFDKSSVPQVRYLNAGGSAVGVHAFELVKKIIGDAATFATFCTAPPGASGERTLTLMSRGDGSSHGHFQSYPFFIESIAFAEDPKCHDPEHNHIIAVARMGETRANELRVLSKTFRQLQELHGAKVVAADGLSYTLQVKRISDGADQAKAKGTSTFNSRMPCPDCLCPHAELSRMPLGALADCELPWSARTLLSESCDHSRKGPTGCACARIQCAKKFEIWPPQDHGGLSPEDPGHPEHGKIVDHAMQDAGGYMYSPMTCANWLPDWECDIFYDPMHCLINVGKGVVGVAVSMYDLLESNDALARTLDSLKLGHLEVGQSHALKEELRARDGVGLATRESRTALNGKDFEALLSKGPKRRRDHPTMGEIVTFEFLEPMLDVALGLTGADAEKQDMAAEFFAIAQPLFVTFSEIRGVMLDKKAGNESQKLGELVRQFYNTYDKVGPAVYELPPASAFQKWPDHYLAWHAPKAMCNWFLSTGTAYSVTSCQAVEHLNSNFKQFMGSCNHHLAIDNLDDNFMAQFLYSKLVRYFKKQSALKIVTGKKRARVCVECMARPEFRQFAEENPSHYRANKQCAVQNVPELKAQYDRDRAVVAPKKLGTRKATLVALAAPARAAHF